MTALPITKTNGRYIVHESMFVFGFIILFGVVTGMWVSHGGVSTLLLGGSDVAAGAGQISGLYAGLLSLSGIALVGRPRVIERSIGLDRIFVWHRMLGSAAALALLVHVVCEVLAAVPLLGFQAVVLAYTGGEPYMAMAFVSALWFFAVAISSIRPIRRRMTYETWYYIHILSYLSIAGGLAHQLARGSDFVGDRGAWWFWLGLNVIAFYSLIVGRWGSALRSVLFPARVVHNSEISPGVHEVTVAVGRFSSRTAEAGQFVFLRVLNRNLWWQSHPYSFSSAPDNDNFCFTIKNLGDASGSMSGLKVGTRIAIEGPYGVTTSSRVDSGSLLLVAGGVGIAPIKAMLERLPADSMPVVLYRARSERDLAHIDALQSSISRVSGTLHVLTGRRSSSGVDPFTPESLESFAPRAKERSVVVFGPQSLINSVVRSALKLGVPLHRIHHERTWW